MFGRSYVCYKKYSTSMFSKELLELDRNTVKLMIDDMQKEIDCQREQLSQKDEEMLEMRKEIQRLQQLLDKK